MPNTKLKTLAAIAVIVISMPLLAAMQGQATESAPLLDVIKQGAQLYDNWAKVTAQTPKETHMLYPKGGKYEGKGSWRCKECHGWDYAGKDGRYSKGSHYTGIKGLIGSTHNSLEKISDKLTDKKSSHDFSGWLENEQINALATFIKYGVVIYDADKIKSADLKNGEAKYRSACASCHGQDGNAIDFKSNKEGIQGIGWLANDNPQETLHKIRWGHPGSNMPSAIADEGMKDKDAEDILRYSQTLD